MKYHINSASDLGHVLKAVRRTAKVRIDDLSETVGVSKQTTTNVEQGKVTVQLGTVLRLLSEMGITVSVDFPEAALPALLKIQQRAQGAAEAARSSMPSRQDTSGMRETAEGDG
ncbi:helix-turn-helix domain-containing protein [Roseateles sp. NT4]|uniref:helix-turn-helix domain-containing protein n=1 Tax=Roseateles sp. NT4 TaxID=3453715 RepID=UPI003EEAB431